MKNKKSNSGAGQTGFKSESFGFSGFGSKKKKSSGSSGYGSRKSKSYGSSSSGDSSRKNKPYGNSERSINYSLDDNKKTENNNSNNREERKDSNSSKNSKYSNNTKSRNVRDKDKSRSFSGNRFAKKTFGSNRGSRTGSAASTAKGGKSGTSIKIEKRDLKIEVDNAKKDAYNIAIAYNIQTDFNKKCIKEAQGYPTDIENVELDAYRLDLRELYTVTIDGDDSKDFDDAISIEKTDTGYKLGIHIADVSHFVGEGSALDREARTRGNSVYLMDKVYPMFPKELSNGLCSLNEGVTRFTMSVFIDIDNKGDVLKSTFHNSAIRSARRLTYNYVQDVLDKKVDEADERLNKLVTFSNEVKNILLKKRIDNGTIEFDLNETKVILDNNGEPTDFIDEKRNESNKIVEEFMLLANCEVAYRLRDMDGAIYRVHGNPDLEKLEDFERIAYNLGFVLKKSAKGEYDFQSFMASIRGKAEEKMLLTLLLRSMKQAVYDTKNIGHFGLGFKFYTHFTSPIRRYTDLLTHRLLKLSIEGKNFIKDNTKKFYKVSADWCSKTERVAIECERDLFKVKACRYLKKYVGNEFNAYISGLTRFGIFAQIEEKGIEGLIRFADSSTYYVYDEQSQVVSDKYSKIKYSMGDKIKIEVLRVDIKGLFIDFKMK